MKSHKKDIFLIVFSPLNKMPKCVKKKCVKKKLDVYYTLQFNVLVK